MVVYLTHKSLIRHTHKIEVLKPEITPSLFIKMKVTISNNKKKKAITAAKGKSSSPSTRKKASLSSHGTKKNGTGMKILLAIAQKHKLGEETPDRHVVASIAGCASKYESFRVTCNNHKKKGFVDYPTPKTITLTPAGWEEIGPELSKIPKTNEEVHRMLFDEKQIKGGKPTLMFKYLLDGCARTKQEIAKAAGYEDYEAKKDSIRVNINSLNQFTEKMADGRIRLSNKVFPFGRPSIGGI